MPTRRTLTGQALILIQGGRTTLTAVRYRADLIRLARYLLLADAHLGCPRAGVDKLLADMGSHDIESVVLEALERRRREAGRLMQPGEDRIPSRRPRRTGPIPAAYEDERKPKGTA